MYFKVGDIIDYHINDLSGTGEVIGVIDDDFYKVNLKENTFFTINFSTVAYLYRWEMKLNVTNRRKQIIENL